MVEHNEFQPGVERMIAEHGRLHEILRQARARLANLAGPDPDAPFTDMAEIFQAVRSELQRHFLEEEGEHLKAVASHCPRLSGEARRIQAEHGELLDQIDRLTALASERPHALESRIAMSNAFNQLCWDLGVHECAENDVLRQAFGAIIKDKDRADHGSLTAMAINLPLPAGSKRVESHGYPLAGAGQRRRVVACGCHFTVRVLEPLKDEVGKWVCRDEASGERVQIPESFFREFLPAP